MSYEIMFAAAAVCMAMLLAVLAARGIIRSSSRERGMVERKKILRPNGGGGCNPSDSREVR